MRRILIVAGREYAEMVKTKTFILSILATPLLIATIAWVSGRVSQSTVKGPRPPQKVAVADLSGRLFASLRDAVEKRNASNPDRRIVLEPVEILHRDPATVGEDVAKRVREKRADFGLSIPADIVDGHETVRGYSRGESFGELEFFPVLQRLVNDALVDARAASENLSRDLIDRVLRRARFENIDVSGGKAQSEGKMVARLMVPFFLMFLMFMGMVGFNQHILTSVLEEKSSRVIEMLLSAVKPFELMAGKTLGLSAVGLTVVVLWGAGGFGVLSRMGIAGAVDFSDLWVFLVYFVLGFFLFSGIFAAVGAACNTLKEAQPLIMPVTMILVIPMVCWFYFAQNPAAPWTVVLSLVPPVSPLVMMIRLAAQPDLPLYQVLVSIVLLAAATVGVVWISARIFRVGILLYGKPPTPREMLRWVRQS